VQRLIRQTEAAECGLACLAMVAGHFGLDIDMASLRRRFSISLRGTTLKSLIEIAAALGLGGRAVRCELDELRQLKTPAILHWGLNHFVVLTRAARTHLRILDPAQGARKVPLKEASREFTGVALELSPSPQFQKKRERTVLQLLSLVKFSPETLKSLAQAIVLTFVIELFVLASPFYMQLTIDEAILKGDGDLLTALAVGFAFIALLQAAAGALRGLSLQFLGTALSFDMEGRLFHHLLRLPLDWFHKRQVGDVQSRFKSVDAIKQFITGGAMAAVFDSVSSIVILGLMLFYAPALAGIAAGAVVLYAILRFSTLELSRRVAGDLLINEAREETRFLETLRAAQTIKVAGQETRREGLQRNAIAATLRSSVRAGNVDIVFGAVKQIIIGLAGVLIIYLGARAVLGASLTVGMLTAFLAYNGQFTSRITALIENLIAWKLLDVNLERLADIALDPREPRIDEGGHDGEIEGAVELRQVHYRYAPSEPEIIKAQNLEIAAGEFVAIAGPSGAGKTTLLKLLSGLYQPTHGDVLIDGRPLSLWNARAVRAQLGVVSQDDTLLQGSIAENIAMFDEHIDMAQVQQCARLAAVHDDIATMPMGYQSLVGDMGSALSGGQKQRLMIARALYRRPRILILDEGTAHLDIATERAINAALAGLAITRIVVAHRPETLRAADRVIELAPARDGMRRALALRAKPSAAAE
jgi:ATP-binding cassette subfamily B protein RaxB